MDNKTKLFEDIQKMVFEEFYIEDTVICFTIKKNYHSEEFEQKIKHFGYKKNNLQVVPIGLKLELYSWFLLYFGVSPDQVKLYRKK